MGRQLTQNPLLEWTVVGDQVAGLADMIHERRYQRQALVVVADMQVVVMGQRTVRLQNVATVLERCLLVRGQLKGTIPFIHHSIRSRNRYNSGLCLVESINAAMKKDDDEIDKARLAQIIRLEYGFNIHTIAFLPKGEDAYVYEAQDATGRQYCVRLQSDQEAATLEKAYEIARTIQNRCGLSSLVAPYRSRRGTFSLSFDGFILAVFPFIQGETLYRQGASEADLAAAAVLLTGLHNCDPGDNGLSIHRERFANPFRAPILQALAIAEAMSGNRTNYQRQVCALLLKERDDILRSLQRMAELQKRSLKAAGEWVLTHGDPNLDNLLKDQEGKLHLTDWGEVAVGPPERDLAAFTGKGFEAFLRQYTSIRQTAVLHLDIFAFYFYRWTMQEIADYTGHILLKHLGPVEDEHAWVELQDYLPIRHNEIAASLEGLRGIIERVQG